MTGKIIDRETAGFLILIIPFAAALVLLFSAWQWILLGIVLLAAWKVWESYYWQQWSERVNPFFNALVHENQGKLTPMDLSIKSNMSGQAAQKFLEKKAAEFGAQKKQTIEQGTVYYFLTGKAIGSVFESSEPLLMESPLTSTPSNELRHTEPFTGLSKLFELEFEREPKPVAQDLESLTLNQTELSKRLETNSSTVGRRKMSLDFPLWSQSKDPEGIAWVFDQKANVFIPAGEE